MKIKLFRANEYRLDATEIDYKTLKTFDDWNKVDVIIVYDNEAYDWLKHEGERLEMYTPCDFYSREEIVGHGEYIHSDELKNCDYEWWNQRWWIEASEAMYHTNDDRWFYTDIRKCP